MKANDEAIFSPGPRRTIAVSGALLLLGLALVGVGPSDIGSGVTLIALALLVLGIHQLGRLGPPLIGEAPDKKVQKPLVSGKRPDTLRAP
jgi:hypothetical protein